LKTQWKNVLNERERIFVFGSNVIEFTILHTHTESVMLFDKKAGRSERGSRRTDPLSIKSIIQIFFEESMFRSGE
jgi:hypothetical protein